MASHPLEKPVHTVPTIDHPENRPAPLAEEPPAPTTGKPPLRLGPADHGRTMTLEEFREADEEAGYRFELARGVLEVTEVPDDPHGQIVSNLYRAVARFDAAHPGVVRRFGGGSEFRLWLPAMISGRNPDLGIVLRGAPKDYRGRRIPCLVAEVVSSRGEDRDYQVKREEYLAFGILEYWIVDLQLRQVTLLTRRGDTWFEQVLRDQEVIPSLVLPGLTTTVADLWTDTQDEDEDEPDNA